MRVHSVLFCVVLDRGLLEVDGQIATFRAHLSVKEVKHGIDKSLVSLHVCKKDTWLYD